MLVLVHKTKSYNSRLIKPNLLCRLFSLAKHSNSLKTKKDIPAPEVPGPNYFPVIGKVKDFFRQHGWFGVTCYFSIYAAGFAFYYALCLLIPDAYFTTLLSYVDFGLTTQYEHNLLYVATAGVLNELSEPLRIALTFFLVGLRMRSRPVPGEAGSQAGNKE
jgi:hypothetical protein